MRNLQLATFKAISNRPFQIEAICRLKEMNMDTEDLTRRRFLEKASGASIGLAAALNPVANGATNSDAAS